MPPYYIYIYIYIYIYVCATHESSSTRPAYNEWPDHFSGPSWGNDVHTRQKHAKTCKGSRNTCILHAYIRFMVTCTLAVMAIRWLTYQHHDHVSLCEGSARLGEALLTSCYEASHHDGIASHHATFHNAVLIHVFKHMLLYTMVHIIYIYICMCIYIYIVYIYTHIHIYHIYTYNMYIYIYIYTYIHTYICVYIYIYIYLNPESWPSDRGRGRRWRRPAPVYKCRHMFNNYRLWIFIGGIISNQIIYNIGNIYIYIYIYICVCVYIYIYTYT